MKGLRHILNVPSSARFLLIWLLAGCFVSGCVKEPQLPPPPPRVIVDLPVRTGLPVVEITTPDKAPIPSKKEGWMQNAQIRIIDRDGTLGYHGITEVRGRGNSTWGFPKKPYTFRTPVPITVLGMKEHRRWILLANWMDRTLLRNHVAFHIARLTGLSWTPSGCFVELMVNGEHKGNYYLCEQIKIDDDRLNLFEMPPGASSGDELTGGYIFELDDHKNEIPLFKTPMAGFPVIVKEPDSLNTYQQDYVKAYFSNLETLLYDQERVKKGEYRQYLDMDSFIDWWFVYELTGNKEPNHPKSVYMHKDRNGKLTAGPVWDFDWGTFRNNQVPGIRNALWYKHLFQDPVFVSRLKLRWSYLRPRLEHLPQFIESEAAVIHESEVLNHEMWPLDKRNINGDEKLTHEEAVKRMVGFTRQRLANMDKYIDNL